MNSTKLIAGLVVIMTAFLAGFIPQYLQKQRLETEVEDGRARLSAAQTQIEIGELQRLASRMMLETSRKNYGIAAGQSTEFFNKVQEMQGKALSPSLKTSLSELMNSRDAITGGLAQGDASVVPEIQNLLERTTNLRQ